MSGNVLTFDSLDVTVGRVKEPIMGSFLFNIL